MIKKLNELKQKIGLYTKKEENRILAIIAILAITISFSLIVNTSYINKDELLKKAKQVVNKIHTIVLSSVSDVSDYLSECGFYDLINELDSIKHNTILSTPPIPEKDIDVKNTQYVIK